MSAWCFSACSRCVCVACLNNSNLKKYAGWDWPHGIAPRCKGWCVCVHVYCGLTSNAWCCPALGPALGFVPGTDYILGLNHNPVQDKEFTQYKITIEYV